MKLSKRKLKWMLNLFPPLLFNRIAIQRISDDYKEMDVVIRHSILNRNLQKTIFGGTIFSAGDPYHAMMYWQIFSQKNYKIEAWLKSAEINYLKPAASDLKLEFRLTDEDILEAETALEKHQRFEKWHGIEAIDKAGNVCAAIRLLVYLRTFKGEHKASF